MGDAGKGTKKDNSFYVGLIGLYLVASILILAFTIFLAVIINSTNDPVTTICGPISVMNMVCGGPIALILILALSYKKGNTPKAQGNGAIKENKPEPKAQKPIDFLSEPGPGARKDRIVNAEEDREIWTLIVQLKESDLASRISAVRELRNYNKPDVEENLTKAMLDDSDLSVRLEAYLALKFQGKDKLGLLLDRLKAASDTKARLDLLDLLRKIGDERQVEALIYLYDFETDKAVKIGILDTLSKFGSPGTKDLAASILRKEDDKDIRINALEALCWDDDVYTKDILQHLLDDPDSDIRERAGKMLHSIELRAI